MQPSVFNGGQPITGLKDFQVEKLIRTQIPDETYTSIIVNSVNNQFPGIVGKLKSREITLIRASLSTGWESIKMFFTALFWGAQLPQEPSIDKDLIGQHLLGNNKNEFSEAGMIEVQKAFMHCYKIVLIISDDCNYLTVKLEQSQFFILARKTGQAVSPILYKALELGLPLIAALGTK